MRSSVRRCLGALVVLSVVALTGCTDGTAPPPVPPTSSAPSPSATPSPTPTAVPFRTVAPTAPVVVLDVADPVQAALDASRALYATAPVVVLAAADDTAAQLTAASAAVALGAPLLLVAPPPAVRTPAPCPSDDSCPVVPPSAPAAADDPSAGLRGELSRLGATALLVVGDAAAPAGTPAVRVPAGAGAAALTAATGRVFGGATPVATGGEAVAVTALVRPGTAVLGAPAAVGIAPSAPASPPTPPAPSPTTTPHGPVVAPLPLGTPSSPARAGLPLTTPPQAPAATVALTGAGPVPLAVLATARAAGVPLVDVPAADPRATSSAVQALAAAKPAHVVAFGAAFGPADRLTERVAAAETGVELPGGGQLCFPQDDGLGGKRYVSLYGSPGMPALGVLGEQDVPATIVRAQQHADPYRALTPDTVVPGVEIIATIASAGAGPDGNYSAERPVEDLLPLVQAAGAAGLTVVLDLQPGRTDFLTQAKLYEPLLELPYVSLALDPEWRLEPDQVHLQQIGHVGIDEVNGVADWLAQMVRDHHLPQKMLVLHQFMLRMITDRDRLDTSHDELAMVIHVDGQGGQGAKVGTWNAIRAGAPAGIHWGWKNFYDEDTPAMLDPAGTYAIQPTPDLVTYQ